MAETPQPAAEAPMTLRDRIRAILVDGSLVDKWREDGTLFADGHADEIMILLVQTGVIVPDFPPAAALLRDLKVHAAQLSLSILACRLAVLIMGTNIITPESDSTRRWFDDYLNGHMHGPIGHPMLWPARLPGLCLLLREWGYAPTPTQPAFVAPAGSMPAETQPEPVIAS